MSLALIAVYPFASVLVLACLSSVPPRYWTWASLGCWLSILAVYLGFAPAILQTGPSRIAVEWLPFLGLNLALRLDGPALLCCLAVIVTILLVQVHLIRRSGSPGSDRVGTWVLFMMSAAVLAGFLSDNILQIFIFWEVSAYFGLLLVAGGVGLSRRTVGLLACHAVGSIALLVGVLLLRQAAGSADLAEIGQPAALVGGAQRQMILALLLLLASLARCAPLAFFSSEKAMFAGPAVLLGTTVLAQSGLFVLARLWPLLPVTPAWSNAAGLLGLAVLLLGTGLAFRAADRIATWAWVIVGQAGVSLMLLALTPDPGLMLIHAAGVVLTPALLLPLTIRPPGKGHFRPVGAPDRLGAAQPPPMGPNRLWRVEVLIQPAQTAGKALWHLARRPLRALVLPLVGGGAAAGFTYATLSTSPGFASVAPDYRMIAAQLGYTDLAWAIGFDLRGIDSFVIIALVCSAALCQTGRGSPPRPSIRAADTPASRHDQRRRAALPVALFTAVLLVASQGSGVAVAVLTGMLLAAALIIARPARPPNPLPLIAAGLLVAGTTGLGSWLFARPFLTTGTILVPTRFGPVSVTSSLGLEVGLILTVIGAVSAAISGVASGAGALLSRPAILPSGKG